MTSRIAFFALLAMLWSVLWSAPCSAELIESRHYVIFFASQSEPRRPRFTHNFCTFVKATVNRSQPWAEPKVETHTISWLPTNGRIRILTLRSSPGRNFALHETLRWARSSPLRVNVYAYGPYEIPAATYANLARQKQRLDAGAYRYKAIDIRRDNAINCLHAVTLADPGWGGMGVPDRAYGIPVLQHLAQAVGRTRSDNDDWVLDKLAIRTGAGIRYQEYDRVQQQHLARVPSSPATPVVAQIPAGIIR
jgi:hypothetical protein